MRKAFTLVEMLIVVVVLVTLMTMTFRLGSIAGPSTNRNKTIARLQRVENCLSGYYAAFGTYPPVAVHGSRNPWLKVSTHGIQNNRGDEDKNIFGWDAEKFRSGSYQKAEDDAWRQVRAACHAQPVDCCFPYPERYSEYIEAKSEQLKEEAAETTSISSERRAMFLAGFDDGVSKNIGRFAQFQDETDWRELQLFKFGLLSYLLPRYLIMMNSDESLYEDFAQWTANNQLPCDALTGTRFNDWRQVCERATSVNRSQLATVANVPSQVACARWMANLEGILHTPHSLTCFGVDVRDKEPNSFNMDKMEIYSPGGYDRDTTSGQYMLDFCAIEDGWRNEIYYYSPPPYQTYTLWSAGQNGRTFPPWISKEELDSTANKCIGAWVEDDIVNMSN